MRVQLLTPDAPDTPTTAPEPAQRNAFTSALDDVASVLQRADTSEDAYSRGSGSLQEAVYERARADVALSVAIAAAQRSTQALQSVLNMQV